MHIDSLWNLFTDAVRDTGSGETVGLDDDPIPASAYPADDFRNDLTAGTVFASVHVDTEIDVVHYIVARFVFQASKRGDQLFGVLEAQLRLVQQLLAYVCDTANVGNVIEKVSASTDPMDRYDYDDFGLVEVLAVGSYRDTVFAWMQFDVVSYDVGD